jgi:hypothetical protein
VLSLLDQLAHRTNDHTSGTRGREAIAGIGWHEPTSSDRWPANARQVSVTIPACNVAYCRQMPVLQATAAP